MMLVSTAWMRDELSKVGYCAFNLGMHEPLESLANGLGSVVSSAPGRPVVDVLSPRPRHVSHLTTLSSVHGDGAFPFHTETAHWREPVELVILRCIEPGAGSRPTLLIDGWQLGSNDAAIDKLAQCRMLVKSGSRSFIAPLLERKGDRLKLRYDSLCMVPVTDHDGAHLKRFEQELERTSETSIRWRAGRCLVFDNRRMLHSRGASKVVDYDRRLERTYIGKLRG